MMNDATMIAVRNSVPGSSRRATMTVAARAAETLHMVQARAVCPEASDYAGCATPDGDLIEPEERVLRSLLPARPPVPGAGEAMYRLARLYLRGYRAQRVF